MCRRRVGAPVQTAVKINKIKQTGVVLLFALGLLLVQGPLLLHLFLVPHAMCEHGDLVEGASTRLDRARFDRCCERPQVDRGDVGEPRHDHCGALALKHHLALLDAPVAAALLVWTQPVETIRNGRETRPVPLLSLAPKGSPPA
jgi:hypothetical protein